MPDEIFDECEALAEMFKEDGLLFIGGQHGPLLTSVDDNKVPASIHVNCNDLWMWACADALPLPVGQIEEFYRAWKANRVTHWSCKQRNMQPQRPVILKMKNEGTWDDELEKLPKNPDALKGGE